MGPFGFLRDFKAHFDSVLGPVRLGFGPGSTLTWVRTWVRVLGPRVSAWVRFNLRLKLGLVKGWLVGLG